MCTYGWMFLVFYAVSEVLQPYNGGEHMVLMCELYSYKIVEKWFAEIFLFLLKMSRKQWAREAEDGDSMII